MSEQFPPDNEGDDKDRVDHSLSIGEDVPTEELTSEDISGQTHSSEAETQEIPQLDTGSLSMEERAEVLKGSAYVISRDDGKRVPTLIEGFGGHAEREDSKGNIEVTDYHLQHQEEGSNIIKITPVQYFSFSGESEERKSQIQNAGWILDKAGNLVPPSTKNPQDRGAIEDYHRRISTEPVEEVQAEVVESTTAFDQKATEDLKSTEKKSRNRKMGSLATEAFLGPGNISTSKDELHPEKQSSSAKENEAGTEEIKIPKENAGSRSREDNGQNGGDNGSGEGDDSPEDNPDDESILGNLDSFDLNRFEEDYYKKHGRQFEPTNPQQVYYAADETGHSQLAYEFRNGSVINWNTIQENLKGKVEDLNAVLHASSKRGHYTGYIKGGKLYEIVRGSHEPTITVSDLTKLPNLMVGQEFGDFTLDKIELGLGKAQFSQSELERILKTPASAIARLAKTKGETYAKAMQMKQSQYVERFSIPRGTDPFAEAELAIQRINAGTSRTSEVMDNAGRVLGGSEWHKARAAEQSRKDALEKKENNFNPIEVREKIRAYADRFADPTYVPKPDEIDEMLKIAEHIEIVSVDLETLTPEYRLTDGFNLSPADTDTFIKNVRSARWVLADGEEEAANNAQAAESWQSIIHRPLFKRRHGRLKESSFLLLQDFKKALDMSNRPEKMPIAQYIGLKYKAYIKSRVLLSRHIKESNSTDTMTKSPAIREYNKIQRRRLQIEENDSRNRKLKAGGRFRQKVNKSLATVHRKKMKVDAAIQRGRYDIAIRASLVPTKISRGLDRAHERNMKLDAAVRKGMDVAATRASIAKRQTIRKIEQGANKAHRGNMKVDAAVQRRMDRIAAQASDAKAKAEEFKRLWDGNHEELLRRPPTDIQGAALRDYVAWERRQGRKPIRKSKK